MLGNFSCFFQNLAFSNYSFRNTTRVSNSLNPDQDRHSVCPDPGPNCLQRFLQKSPLAWNKLIANSLKACVCLCNQMLFLFRKNSRSWIKYDRNSGPKSGRTTSLPGVLPARLYPVDDSRKSAIIPYLYIYEMGIFSFKTIQKSRLQMSRGMRFPTMWYVRPAKPQISLGIRTV